MKGKGSLIPFFLDPNSSSSKINGVIIETCLKDGTTSDTRTLRIEKEPQFSCMQSTQPNVVKRNWSRKNKTSPKHFEQQKMQYCLLIILTSIRQNKSNVMKHTKVYTPLIATNSLVDHSMYLTIYANHVWQRFYTPYLFFKI